MKIQRCAVIQLRSKSFKTLFWAYYLDFWIHFAFYFFLWLYLLELCLKLIIVNDNKSDMISYIANITEVYLTKIERIIQGDLSWWNFGLEITPDIFLCVCNSFLMHTHYLFLFFQVDLKTRLRSSERFTLNPWVSRTSFCILFSTWLFRALFLPLLLHPIYSLFNSGLGILLASTFYTFPFWWDCVVISGTSILVDWPHSRIILVVIQSHHSVRRMWHLSVKHISESVAPRITKCQF
jgi:hypothetical protein